MELAYAIPAAIGLGALHSLEPGHGKGVVSAYLIATRGRTRDAILLGMVTAFTHTLSIVVLSLTVSGAVERLANGPLVHWLELFAGVLITLIGAKILMNHARPGIVTVGKLSQMNGEACGHGHHHHIHSHEDPQGSLGRLASIGLLTGLIPCPSAMAIFLASLAAGQLSLGVGLVASFSLGSAITMSAIGILVVRAGSTLKRLDSAAFVHKMGYASSILILCIGALITVKSLFAFV